MSLPFLRKKQVAGLIMAKRNPDGSKTETGNEQDQEDSHPLHSAASDLVKAIEAKDIPAVAAALKAAFEIADSQPHEEGPHVNEEQE